MRISPIGTWPVCTARLISGCLISEALLCTVICSLPPLATSSANWRAFLVWKVPSEYGVGMSHLVCAKAPPAPIANAMAIVSLCIDLPSEKSHHNTAMNAAVRVASDVGGTFTDSIAYDEESRTITVSKVSTTPEDRALGTIAGLAKA